MSEAYHNVTQAAEACGIAKKLLYAYLNAGKFTRSFKSNSTRWQVSWLDIADFRRGLLDVSGTFKRKKPGEPEREEPDYAELKNQAAELHVDRAMRQRRVSD
jgi:hypothetical protein